MTLDEATGLFDHEPSDRTAAQLLGEATTYHRDGMIETDTYERIVLRVAEWLRDDGL